MAEILLELVDAGTREAIEANPRAKALLALMARLIIRFGLFSRITTTCPTCKTTDALTIHLAANRATCSRCGLSTTLARVMEERGEREQLRRMMTTRPRRR